MKKAILVLFSAVTLFSCTEQSTNHETKWSSDKKDSVVYVNYRNDDGSFTNFYMNYLLFSTLFRQGGYGSVYNYYQVHPSEFQSRSNYSTYRGASPIRETPSRSFNNSSRTIDNPVKSYSSPSRSYSSPTRSYSSPSRSYSSPSTHSYSSPSRSFSSPSRSFSSPSRGR